MGADATVVRGRVVYVHVSAEPQEECAIVQFRGDGDVRVLNITTPAWKLLGEAEALHVVVTPWGGEPVVQGDPLMFQAMVTQSKLPYYIEPDVWVGRRYDAYYGRFEHRSGDGMIVGGWERPYQEAPDVWEIRFPWPGVTQLDVALRVSLIPERVRDAAGEGLSPSV
jgi:hypothetical protein